jgi:DNA-binding transcriptional MerR regulator
MDIFGGPTMPLKEKTIGKLYWTIGEVAEQLGVNTSMLRYWEKEFGMLRPKRTNRGDRLYTQDDIKLVRTIHELLKDRGYTIQGAKDHLRGAVKQVDATTEVRERLLRIRGELLELRGLLDAEEHRYETLDA